MAAVQQLQFALLIQIPGFQHLQLAIICPRDCTSWHKYNIVERKSKTLGNSSIDLSHPFLEIFFRCGFYYSNDMFLISVVCGEKSESGGGQSRNFLYDQCLQIAWKDIVAVDDQHFLDTTGDVEMTFVQKSKITGFIKVAVIAFQTHPEVSIFFQVAPVAICNAVAGDKNFSDVQIRIRFLCLRIGNDEVQVFDRCTDTDNLFDLFSFFFFCHQDGTVFLIGFVIKFQSAVVLASKSRQTDIFGKTIARCHSIWRKPEHPGEFLYRFCTDKFRAIHKMCDLGQWIFCRFFRRKNTGTCIKCRTRTDG